MDDYPTEEELDTIKAWKADDLSGMMEYVKSHWKYADDGYWTETGWGENDIEYQISTAGWSGNEDIIYAMRQNYVWWSLFWYQSNRGGHYIFKRMKI